MTTRRLRVCVVSPLYHPNLGGLGRQAQLLSERLRKEGVELFVISRRMSGMPPAEFSPDVEVIRLPVPFPRTFILEEINLRNILISVSFSMGCIAALIRHRRRYDIVHFHGASIPLFLSLPFLRWMGKKVIAKVAAANLGTEAGSLSGKYWILGDLLASLVRKVDVFIAISEEIKDGLIRDGVPSKNIRRISNFIDPLLFSPPDPEEKNKRKEELGYKGKLLILFAGRLVRRKGVEFLLQAWVNILFRFPEARLLVLGDGPLLEFFKKMTSTLGISSSVHFYGRVDNVSEYLKAADIFVLPSLQEGLSNSLLEAMASGIAVLATRIGGVTDVIEENKDAILVEPGNPIQISDGLIKLLEDESLRKRFSAIAAEKMYRLYSMESRVGKYISLYREVLRGDPK